MFSSAQAATSTLYRQSIGVREDLGKVITTVLKNKVIFKELGSKMMDWIHLAGNRVHGGDPLNTRKNPREGRGY
jgi:hypothetical protein